MAVKNYPFSTYRALACALLLLAGCAGQVEPEAEVAAAEPPEPACYFNGVEASLVSSTAPDGSPQQWCCQETCFPTTDPRVSVSPPDR